MDSNNNRFFEIKYLKEFTNKNVLFFYGDTELMLKELEMFHFDGLNNISKNFIRSRFFKSDDDKIYVLWFKEIPNQTEDYLTNIEFYKLLVELKIDDEKLNIFDLISEINSNIYYK